MEPSVAAGTLLCLFGALLSPLGLILMKKSVDDAVGINEPALTCSSTGIVCAADGGIKNNCTTEISSAEKRSLSRQASYEKIYRIALVRDAVPYCAHWQWAIGVTVYLFSQLVSLLALSLIDQVTWGVLGLSSLVSNAVLASVVLHEVFTVHDFAATSVIIFGTALVVISRRSANQEYTVNELVLRFEAAPFLIYMSVLCCATIILGVVVYRKGNSWPSSLGVAWSSVASLLGSTSVLLGKCSSEIFKGLYGADDVTSGADASTAMVGHVPSDVGDPLSATLILVMFTLTCLGALHSTNLTLVHGDALVMIPWLTVSNTMLVILGGMIYFSEYKVFFSVWRACGFVVGVLTAIAGAVWLQAGHERRRQPFWGQSVQAWLLNGWLSRPLCCRCRCGCCCAGGGGVVVRVDDEYSEKDLEVNERERLLVESPPRTTLYNSVDLRT
jgi:hypothetical protein